MSVASVTIAPGAWADPRVHRLARLLGLSDPRFALIMLGHLWARCTFLGTDTPPLSEIEACLDDRGPELLLKCGLGEQLEDGTIRVKGGIAEDGTERIGWYRNLRPEPASTSTSSHGRARGGKARAEAAARAGGKFVRATTNHQQPPASGVAGENAGASITSKTDFAGGSGSGSGSEEKVSPARAGDAGDAGDQQRPATTNAGDNAGTSILAGERLRRLLGDIWAYAQRKHAELRAAGIDPHAQTWSAMPTGTGADDLKARVRELAAHGLDDAQILAACSHVIDVRAAEARAFNPPHLRYFIATRTFEAEAFSKASELSPTQAAAQAAQGKPGPGGRAPAQPRVPTPERPRSTNLVKP